ncbi:hypothetical protein SAY86_023195 [Trapa natans]|uniref:Uncharacterized protein n=1 Tax=Trapa natans TaxID=22666 RepID=A0AAN7MAA8_TRANT|nr:hypothetical protein SAY86_023195 [Trapa natans]
MRGWDGAGGNQPASSDDGRARVKAEMPAALHQNNQMGSDLGIVSTSCRSFMEDPSSLTRWIIGDEKLQ